MPLLESRRPSNNYAHCLLTLQRYAEVKSLLRKTKPVARRVLGEGHRITLKIRWTYAEALYKDDGATLDDLREAVTTLDETARIAQRMLGSAHPVVRSIEHHLPISRAMLRAREAHPSGSS